MSRTDRLLGSAPVASLGRFATRRRLRILAMHDVSDVSAFERMLDGLLDVFQPVDSTRVLDWLSDSRDLPANALWLTFDDGDRSTIVDAAPVLERRGVSATAFVCPGLIEDRRLPWWRLVLEATRSGHPVSIDGHEVAGQDAVRALKVVPDEERRERLGHLAERFPAEDPDPVTVEDLRSWRESGGEIGNHTWDHPCLDRCGPGSQIDQIDRATAWLDRHHLWDRRLFAYPNGDRTEHAEDHLRRSGFDLVALFDHRLSSRSDPMRLSRLRLDSNAPVTRAMAITSGWHSAIMSQRDSLLVRIRG